MRFFFFKTTPCSTAYGAFVSQGPWVPLIGIVFGNSDCVGFLFCSFFLIHLFIYLFVYFWLRWVFVTAHGLSLVVVSGGYSSLRCAGFSLQ